MKASKRSISFEALFSISLLVLVSAIAYLPLIRRFGYYRDDWYLMYGGMMQGAKKFIEIYSIDRPFIGYFMAGL